jgi:hypothetical protein
MKSQFTPGPWRTTGLNVRAGDALICFATDHWYAEDDGFYAFTDLAEKQANATLIASAPDLLSALEAVTKAYVELVQSDYPPSWNVEKNSEVIAARAAIAKAKGNL